MDSLPFFVVLWFLTGGKQGSWAGSWAPASVKNNLRAKQRTKNFIRDNRGRFIKGGLGILPTQKGMKKQFSPQVIDALIFIAVLWVVIGIISLFC
jgi:hypothetical protein